MKTDRGIKHLQSCCIFQALAFIAGVFFFLPACVVDNVAWDLMTYMNQGILNIAELERRPLERYALVRGEYYTTDQRIYTALKEDIIPEYKRFLDLLQQIEPKTEEVRKLHWVYIQGAKSIYRGFKIKMIGLEKGDEVLVGWANEEIERGRKQNEKWRKELAALHEAHGIEQESHLPQK